jgi:uncharacterized membrane protein YccC
MAWVLLGAYIGVIGPVAERTGWFAALMFMIGLGLGEASVGQAIRDASLVAVGGAWAIVVITVFWPFHPYRPIMRACGRSLVDVAELLALIGKSASGDDLDREVARLESGESAAEAVIRWPSSAFSTNTDLPTVPDGVSTRRQPASARSALRACRANFSLSSFWFRYALRFGIAAGIGLVVSRSLGVDKGYWVLITSAVVIKPQLSLSTTTTIHRVAGTLLGAVFGAVVVVMISDRWGLIAALVALSVIGVSLIRVNYGLAVIFITPLVLVMMNVALPGQWQLAGTRVLDTLIGAGIGLLATTTILPGWEQGRPIARAATDDLVAGVRGGAAGQAQSTTRRPGAAEADPGSSEGLIPPARPQSAYPTHAARSSRPD